MNPRPARPILRAARDLCPSPLLNPETEHPAWYCLRAQPRHEAIAARRLRQMEAVEVFCPRLRYRRPRAGGQMWMTEALFPGYLFARFDLALHGRAIGHAHGLRGIVHFGGHHPSVPPEAVAALRAAAGPEELAQVSATPCPGDEVVMTGGGFHGLRAVVTQYFPAKERVRVLLDFMGRQMEIEMSSAAALPPRPHPLRRLG